MRNVLTVLWGIFLFVTVRLVSANTFNFYSTQPITQQIKGYTKPGDDTLIKKKFLKKVLSALSIKGNLRKKEADRIEKIVRTYFIKDSVNLALLGKKLETYATTGFRFDSLLKILKNNTVSPNDLKLRIDSLIKNKDNQACAECKTDLSDKEMQALVDKVAPMISEKAKEDELKEQKQKKIKIIRQILSSQQPIIDTLEINDTLSKRYRLSLKKKVVYGFHPSWMNKRYFNYNFSILSTLAYYGYELDGNTGEDKNKNSWDTSAVIRKAKKEGCKVDLVVYCLSRAELHSFLKSAKAQTVFTENIIRSLKAKGADGVNVLFENVGKDNRNRITIFLKALARSLKDADSKYTLTLTLPCIDEENDYDVEALQDFVEYFVIDFTKKNNYGPIVPLLGSDYSLDAGVSRYLSKKVPAEKYIACLPYRGVHWHYQSGNFEGYEPYERIIKSIIPDYGKIYEKNSSVRSDIVSDGDTIGQIWFDDEKTLSEKYEYILGNNLAGVGIWTLGDDDKRQELWDALLDKMIYFDSTDVQYIIKPKPKIKEPLGFWASIKHELLLYKELFQHPCHFNSKEKREDLKSDNYIGWVAVGFTCLLALVSVFSIAKRRALGDDWEKRKLFLIIQIILVVFVMISLLMYCFLNPDFYHFGSTNSDVNNCETSFGVILAVLATGFLIGSLAMKFLVIPLIKPKEIP